MAYKWIRVSEVDAPIAQPITGDIEAVDVVNVLVPFIVDLPLGPGPHALAEPEIADAREPLEPFEHVLPARRRPLAPGPEMRVVLVSRLEEREPARIGPLPDPVGGRVGVGVPHDLLVGHAAIAKSARERLPIVLG